MIIGARVQLPGLSNRLQTAAHYCPLADASVLPVAHSTPRTLATFQALRGSRTGKISRREEPFTLF